MNRYIDITGDGSEHPPDDRFIFLEISATGYDDYDGYSPPEIAYMELTREENDILNVIKEGSVVKEFADLDIFDILCLNTELFTRLSYAAYVNNLPMVFYLLNSGIDPNELPGNTNQYMVITEDDITRLTAKTPLEYAVINTNYEMTRLLLEAGANPNIRDHSVLDIICNQFYSRNKYDPRFYSQLQTYNYDYSRPRPKMAQRPLTKKNYEMDLEFQKYFNEVTKIGKLLINYGAQGHYKSLKCPQLSEWQRDKKIAIEGKIQEKFNVPDDVWNIISSYERERDNYPHYYPKDVTYPYEDEKF